jgi:chromosome segregation ATPase
MKTERITVLVSIFLFLLVLFTYARFTHIEQRMAQQRIEGLNSRLDSLIATLRDSDSRYKSYTEDLKKMNDRVELLESEKKDVWAKLDNVSRELENMHASLAPADVSNSKKMVELGAISVKKQAKTGK